MKKMNFNLYGGKSFIIGSLAVSMLIMGTAQGMKENRDTNNSQISRQNNISSPTSTNTNNGEEEECIDDFDGDDRLETGTFSGDIERFTAKDVTRGNVPLQRSCSSGISFPFSATTANSGSLENENIRSSKKTRQFQTNLQPSPGLTKLIPTSSSSLREAKHKRHLAMLQLQYNGLRNYFQFPILTQSEKKINVRVPLVFDSDTTDENKKKENKISFPEFGFRPLNQFLFSDTSHLDEFFVGDLLRMNGYTRFKPLNFRLINPNNHESYISMYKYDIHWRMSIVWPAKQNEIDGARNIIRMSLPLGADTPSLVSKSELCGLILEPQRVISVPPVLSHKISNRKLGFNRSIIFETSDLVPETQQDNNNDIPPQPAPIDINVNDDDDDELVGEMEYVGDLNINGDFFGIYNFPQVEMLQGQRLYDTIKTTFNHCFPREQYFSNNVSSVSPESFLSYFVNHSKEHHWVRELTNYANRGELDLPDLKTLSGNRDIMLHLGSDNNFFRLFFMLNFDAAEPDDPYVFPEERVFSLGENVTCHFEKALYINVPLKEAFSDIEILGVRQVSNGDVVCEPLNVDKFTIEFVHVDSIETKKGKKGFQSVNFYIMRSSWPNFRYNFRYI